MAKTNGDLNCDWPGGLERCKMGQFGTVLETGVLGVQPPNHNKNVALYIFKHTSVYFAQLP